MTTHIDRMLTDVIVEPEPEAEQERQDSRWDQADQLARMLQSTLLLELRTRAEGFDD